MKSKNYYFFFFIQDRTKKMKRTLREFQVALGMKYSETKIPTTIEIWLWSTHTKRKTRD